MTKRLGNFWFVKSREKAQRGRKIDVKTLKNASVEQILTKYLYEFISNDEYGTYNRTPTELLITGISLNIRS